MALPAILRNPLLIVGLIAAAALFANSTSQDQRLEMASLLDGSFTLDTAFVPDQQGAQPIGEDHIGFADPGAFGGDPQPVELTQPSNTLPEDGTVTIPLAMTPTVSARNVHSPITVTTKVQIQTALGKFYQRVFTTKLPPGGGQGKELRVDFAGLPAREVNGSNVIKVTMTAAAVDNKGVLVAQKSSASILKKIDATGVTIKRVTPLESTYRATNKQGNVTIFQHLRAILIGGNVPRLDLSAPALVSISNPIGQVSGIITDSTPTGAPPIAVTQQQDTSVLNEVHRDQLLSDLPIVVTGQSPLDSGQSVTGPVDATGLPIPANVDVNGVVQEAQEWEIEDTGDDTCC